jgi:hypothetical protein
MRIHGRQCQRLLAVLTVSAHAATVRGRKKQKQRRTEPATETLGSKVSSDSVMDLRFVQPMNVDEEAFVHTLRESAHLHDDSGVGNI